MCWCWWGVVGKRDAIISFIMTNNVSTNWTSKFQYRTKYENGQLSTWNESIIGFFWALIQCVRDMDTISHNGMILMFIILQHRSGRKSINCDSLN